MAEKRCLLCHSNNIKKFGFVSSTPRSLRGEKKRKKQRYFCRDCEKTFSHNHWTKHKRHTSEFIKETVRMYVESKSSSREVARSMKVNQSTIVRWVNEVGELSLKPQQANKILQPKWKGILGIDGKFLHVNGKKMACLLAADLSTLDITYWEIASSEDEVGCRNFLINLREEIYPLRGIVTDLGRGKVWLKLIADIFPEIPHQACVVHFDRYVDQILPKSKLNKHYQENQILRQLINNLLYASSFNDAEEIFSRLQRVKSYFKTDYQITVLKSLTKHFDLLTAHFHYSDLERTNNITENIIKQLDRKIFLLSDFESAQAATNFIKLWVYSYRFKPIASSNYLSRNGLSPLQLAGVSAIPFNWLDFALTSNN
jgi:transposase-like protein